MKPNIDLIFPSSANYYAYERKRIEANAAYRRRRIERARLGLFMCGFVTGLIVTTFVVIIFI